MQVSVDGLRRSATKTMNQLGDKIELISDYLPDFIKEELFDCFNDAARNVAIFNCVYSDKIEMFNDLSEEIDVRQLGEKDKE